MDRNRVKCISQVEPSASKSAGSVELRNGTSQIVWYYARLRNSGYPIGLFRNELSATLTGMVLWSERQTRQ